MNLYKTTHQTDWRRVQWVHDEEYDPVGSYAFEDDKETQAAVDVELRGLDNGSLVVLGAIVETKCPHCKFWQDSDSLWGIVVDANEDLEAWGTANLDIPEAPETKDCEEAPNDDTEPEVTERRHIPLSDRAMDYVKKAAAMDTVLELAWDMVRLSPDVTPKDAEERETALLIVEAAKQTPAEDDPLDTVRRSLQCDDNEAHDALDRLTTLLESETAVLDPADARGLAETIVQSDPMNHPDRWADRVRELTTERDKFRGLLLRVSTQKVSALARMDPGLGHAIREALKEDSTS